MNKELSSLILTGTIGLFSLIGIAINGFFGSKNRKKIVDFIYGALFSVITMITLIYLMPEIYNCLGFKQLYLSFIFLGVGYITMKVVSKYYDLPKKEKRTKKEMIKTDNYIATMLLLVFAFYNLIVGLEIYSTILANMEKGIQQVIITSFKNSFIGFLFFYLLNQENISKTKKRIAILSFTFTPLIGNIFMLCINKTSNATILGCSFSLIVGMFLFILVTEIIANIKKSKNKKSAILGLVIGTIWIAISYIL